MYYFYNTRHNYHYYYLSLVLLALTFTYTEQACTAAAGSYCASTVDTSSILCPIGFYCTGVDPYASTACPVHTHRSTTGATAESECSACPAFTVANSVGTSECHLCEAGKYHSLAGTAPNQYGTCVDCASGSSSAVNSTQCSSCIPGKYSSGGSGCLPCRPGYYSDSQGASTCTPCGAGNYTFVAAGNGYAAVWGASDQSQCVALPNAGSSLICLPGTRMQGAGCTPCPIGYYCPVLMNSEDDVNAVRACPEGKSSANTGAISESDCSVLSSLQPYVLESCSIAPGGAGALAQLSVTAMTTSSSTNTVLFATATAVYRLFLVQGSTGTPTNSIDNLAGLEGTAGSPLIDAVGTLARFTTITAIGVDFDVQEATIVVVGDGDSVRMINVFTKQVSY